MDTVYANTYMEGAFGKAKHILFLVKRKPSFLTVSTKLSESSDV
jgi:hypothetical protein